ncbi:MAG: glycosyltransferase family 39 protein [Verrucomicrobia bacterium]|nr:glycosyltransferase family 39 protein [Verrucomicrobiota bacterium]
MNNPTAPSPRSQTRLLVGVFLAALAVHLGLGSIGLHHTLLGEHGFRPVQTAISADYYLRDGISLHYRTPVMGPPYEMPLEFPLYQAVVAWTVKTTGLGLDFTGRIVSWIFFFAGLPAAYLLLGRFPLRRAQRLLVLSLLLLSPLYLFFSRHFLMESTVLAFSLWFLVAFERFLTRPHWSSFVAAAVCGALAGMVKVTSFAVFLIAALLLLVAALRSAQRPAAWRLWWRAGLGVAIPFAASVWWVFFTWAIRHRNPEAVFLDVHFGFWSFGDLAQRLSGRFWLKTYQVWTGSIVSEAGLALLLLYFCWLRGRLRWLITGCLAAFLSGQLIFSNLYFVHDYYFYASGVFLVAAVGLALVEILEQPAIAGRSAAALVVGLAVIQVGTYARTYYAEQSTNVAPPPVCRLLDGITGPEDLVVILGHDWDAFIPYYAHRPALMLRAGRERDPADLRRSMERLNPTQVGAVVINGALWHDEAFVDQTMAALKLGHRPLFSNHLDLGIWVPVARQARLRDEFEPEKYPPFELSQEEFPASGPHTLLARTLARHPAFTHFSPRPIRATALADFGTSPVEGRDMVNAPAPTEIVLPAQPGARRITGTFGILDAAYREHDYTDGVEFVIAERRPDGSERDLFRRLLNPRWVFADRGPLPLDVALPPDVRGEIVLRTLPGPANNASYDWAYWGYVTMR